MPSSSTRETQMTRFPALFVLAALTVAANAPKAPVRNVVLVHGAWADGSSWAKVIPILEKAGLHVVAVQNPLDRKSTRLNSSHQIISYAVFCLKKKKNQKMSIDVH